MSDDASGHDPYAAWRVPAYRWYMAGSLAMLVGSRMQVVAILWEIYERTGDELSLGLVGGIQAIPMMGLALPAGYLADRFSRKKLIVFCLAGTGATSLALAGWSAMAGPNWLMYALLFVDATFLSLARPARQAVLPALVPRAVFTNAVSWRSSLFQVSSVIGPAIGGFVVGWWAPACYLASAGSELIFALIFVRIRMTQARADRLAPTRAMLLEGIRFIWHKRLILMAITLDMFAVLLGGAVYLLPVYARDILNVGETGFGFLNAAPAAGAFVMALFIAHAPPMKHAGRNLLLAVAGFGAATIVFGFSTNFYLSLATLFLTGLFDNVSVVIRHTLVQMLTPDEMRGRVSAVNGVFIGSSNQLGGLESGLVAKAFGPVFSVVSGGIGTLIVVGAIALGSKRLRRLGRLDDLSDRQ